MEGIVQKIWGMVVLVFSKWKILSAYVVFSTLVLSGWYIDIAGLFSSQENYAGTLRAQHGDINIYNVLAFFIGTVFYILLMLYDYMRMRLDKLQSEDGNVRNTALIGDANQSIAQNSQNSPALTNSPEATINYNITGITEERCRAIFDEKWLIAVRDLSFESVDKAEERTKEFRSDLLARISKIEKGFEAFGDPAFQFLLIDAQKAAATTDRKNDYQVLAELLARRTKVGNDRKSQIHIKKAVEMLPFVTDDALLGLTVTFVLLKIIPVSGVIEQGLEVLDETLRKVIGDGALPEGSQWVESLEACGLVKIALGSFMSLTKSAKIIGSHLEGYRLPGLKKDGENYKKAIELLQGVGLPPTILADHELDKDYVRLNVVEESNIENLVMERRLAQGATLKINFTEEQQKVLHQIYALYETDQPTKDRFDKLFEEEMTKYPYLKMVREWWDQVNTVFEVTMTGVVLGNANANKYDEKVPMIYE